MGCNCTEIDKKCGCNTKPCCKQTDCSCKVRIGSDCWTYTGDTTECSGIETDTIGTEVIQQLDAFICEKFDEVQNFFAIVNIGDGAEVYKGINLLGQKELRTFTKTGDLITITENDDDIEISIDEDALNDFIEGNQSTYTVENLSDGAEIYKDSTVVGDNTQFNLRTLKSNTLSIVQEEDELFIDTPSTADVPSLYVNNLYEPSYEEWVSAGGNLATNPTFVYKGAGTIAKPFTDSVVYTSTVTKVTTPNTSIQNALDAYVGSGTRLAPELQGYTIVIQDNTGFYTFAGDFSYNDISVFIESNITSTTTGFIIDMDDPTFFNDTGSTAKLTISNGKGLYISGDGLQNSGSDYDTNLFTNNKTCTLTGEGIIYSATNDISKYIINSDPDSTANGTDGFNNDGAQTFTVECQLRAVYQGIYKVGGKSRVNFYGRIVSGFITTQVDVTLKAMHQTGGSVRFFNGSKVEVQGAVPTKRTDVFTFEPTNGFTPTFTGNGAILEAQAENLFVKLTSDTVTLSFNNSPSSVSFNVTNIVESPNIWAITLNNNYFQNGTIDYTKADLTNSNARSAFNIIGSNIIESLRIFGSRALAVTAGLPKNSAFINRKTVSTGSFVTGEEYSISVVGDTDFTAIGASSNTVGINFTATGVGGGTTGQAYSHTRDILI